MSSASIHDKLSRVRKPAVHISYEVETEGGKVVKTLPFVVGVLGDFAGKSTKPPKELKELKDRSFIPIDRDNINEIMGRMAPGVEYRVKNTLQEGGGEFAVKLGFNSMEDFEPAQIVQQVKPLQELQELRDRLSALLAKVDRSDKLEALLEQILQNKDDLQKLASELGMDKSGGPSDGKD